MLFFQKKIVYLHGYYFEKIKKIVKQNRHKSNFFRSQKQLEHFLARYLI